MANNQRDYTFHIRLESFVLYSYFREDKLSIDGKLYVYNEREGKVVQHKVIGNGTENNKWHSFESLDSV